uniref:Uncharacterized protein n=1 Tax=Rhizophora mucronata TaxID=61149 RepID=A0A2P2QK21_RHIMU
MLLLSVRETLLLKYELVR